MRHAPQEWRRAYENDGFAIVAGLLDAAMLSQLRDNLDSISATSVPPGLREKVFLERDHVKNNPQWYAGLLSPKDCGDAIRQIADLPLFSASFAELILYPAVLDVLEVLLASSEFSFHSMIARPKAARVGNGISNGNFHRDTPFEKFTSCDTIQVILGLDDMTGANGGTAFIRGSHQSPTRKRQSLVGGKSRQGGWTFRSESSPAARLGRECSSRPRFCMPPAIIAQSSRAARYSWNGLGRTSCPRLRFVTRIRA